MSKKEKKSPILKTPSAIDFHQVSADGTSKMEGDPFASGMAIDLSANGVGFITQDRIPNGSMVIVSWPSLFDTKCEFRAQVISCTEIPTSGRVISANPKHAWRVTIRFDFRTPDEQRATQALLESL